ncbi:hypothetical protein ANCDUO_23398 [Ancylostoma duodenale]|uniref:Reverse transcriptase domain-containing protein n=1 Tax=Ancylostoma duodenale TaxID=51022 RepID=A0A0C2FIJ5_9BILA|nr:hypothetical protein ANCDUO_23398 [Ancylostoma duodenale]
MGYGVFIFKEGKSEVSKQGIEITPLRNSNVLFKDKTGKATIAIIETVGFELIVEAVFKKKSDVLNGTIIQNKMVAGVRGVTTYLDDILVCGKTEQEHLENSLALFQRISEYALKVRIGKCLFAGPEIRYLGFILDRNDRRPKKIKEISDDQASRLKSAIVKLEVIA